MRQVREQRTFGRLNRYVKEADNYKERAVLREQIREAQKMGKFALVNELTMQHKRLGF